jgi:hypothetical protein
MQSIEFFNKKNVKVMKHYIFIVVMLSCAIINQQLLMPKLNVAKMHNIVMLLCL